MIEATNFQFSRCAYNTQYEYAPRLSTSVAEYIHALGIPLLKTRGLFSAFNRFHYSAIIPSM